MGKRGPIPKKKMLKVLSGNLPMKKNFIGSPDSMQNFNPPTPPETFTPDELKVWNTTIELLKPLQILENIDGAILGAFCSNYVLWRTAQAEIQAAAKKSRICGLLAAGAGGTAIINPLLTISRRAEQDMVSYAAQMGMTPAARMRIDIEKPKPAENPFLKIKGAQGERMGKPGEAVREIVFD